MKTYKVTLPAVWFEISAKNKQEAIDEFWWCFDQMEERKLLVEEQ